MRLSATICILFSLFFLSASAQEKINTLYLKSDNIPDRIVTIAPIPEQCYIDSSKIIRLVFEGKVSEKNVRLVLTFKNKKGGTKIKVDADGDLRPDQKADIEIFGSNPAVDKSLYAIEDEKDEAVVVITKITESTVEGNFSSKYWDSAMNMRKLSASLKFSTPILNR